MRTHDAVRRTHDAVRSTHSLPGASVPGSHYTMKILHTGDWHMNDVLGRVDRTEDIFRCIEKIAPYLDERAVDVLLVAGDLFSERSRP